MFQAQCPPPTVAKHAPAQLTHLKLTLSTVSHASNRIRPSHEGSRQAGGGGRRRAEGWVCTLSRTFRREGPLVTAFVGAATIVPAGSVDCANCACCLVIGCAVSRAEGGPPPRGDGGQRAQGGERRVTIVAMHFGMDLALAQRHGLFGKQPCHPESGATFSVYVTDKITMFGRHRSR